MDFQGLFVLLFSFVAFSPYRPVLSFENFLNISEKLGINV